MERGEMVFGGIWKSSDDMKAVMSRKPIASRCPRTYRSSLLLEESLGTYRYAPKSNLETKPPLSKDGMLVHTYFSCSFIKKRAKVLKEQWAKVTKTMALYGLSCHASPRKAKISFSTTPRTRGADIVYKARDLFHLLAWTKVPPSKALQILDGSLLYDVIWTEEIHSKLPFDTKVGYNKRLKNIRRNIKGLEAVSGCSIFFNRNSVAAINKCPDGLSLVRSVVTGCLFYGQNPGTSVRLINMSRERNGQTDNLEMDAYGFETAAGVKFICSNENPQADRNNQGLLDYYPRPNSLTEKFVFGPSVNKDGALVCGSFFFEDRDKAVAKAWPLLKLILEDHDISCTMYLAERFMTLSTTSRTEDPDIIYKARDVLEILSFTSAPPLRVLKVLTHNLQYDMIRIGSSDGGYCSEYKIDRKLFEKRRSRLSRHYKELGKKTRCSIFDDGRTVLALGYRPQSMKLVRIIVKRCIVSNVRPETMLQKVIKFRRDRKKPRESFVLRGELTGLCLD